MQQAEESKQSREISFLAARQLAKPLFVDVRSESEFALDHIPGAVNLPVLNDAERAATGTVYHQQSAEEARFLGLDLVSGKLPQLLRDLAALAKKGTPVIYCWRGGLRSQAAFAMAELLRLPCYRLKEGYREYRRLVNAYFAEPLPFRVVVLDGLTGVGKTRILAHLRQEQGLQAVDLEALAQNRGSVFGNVGYQGQPSQKYFQSLLYQQLSEFDESQPVIVECESRRIGSVLLSDHFFAAMQQGEHILVYDSIAGRSRRIVADYQPEAHQAQIVESLQHLAKRLGKEALARLSEQIEAGEYLPAVAYLLEHYYDPLYRYPSAPSAAYGCSVASADEARAAAEIAAYVKG